MIAPTLISKILHNSDRPIIILKKRSPKLLSPKFCSEKIAVEVKSFIGNSSLSDFHLAVGQFINYRIGLKSVYPDRKLFLAVPNSAYETFFKKEFPRMVIRECQLDIVVYDVKTEVIVTWKI